METNEIKLKYELLSKMSKHGTDMHRMWIQHIPFTCKSLVTD